ncbi:MAG: hypothetical protein F6K42_33910 [Leptolyngbya sp. SIO1D8]|nr:hypothetical protein [Leptolyngbya sp. SIO1D8]
MTSPLLNSEFRVGPKGRRGKETTNPQCRPSVPIDQAGHHFTEIAAIGGCRGTRPGVSVDFLLASDRLNCRRVLGDETRCCVGVLILANPKSFCCWIPWVKERDPRNLRGADPSSPDRIPSQYLRCTHISGWGGKATILVR